MKKYYKNPKTNELIILEDDDGLLVLNPLSGEDKKEDKIGITTFAPGKRKKKSMITEIIELFEKGFSAKEIVKKTGATASYVYKHKPKKKVDEEADKGKEICLEISRETKNKIITEFNLNKTIGEIAKSLKLHPSDVKEVLEGIDKIEENKDGFKSL